MHAQVCTKCQVEKAAEEFNRNKVRPDGLCSYCKVCNAAAAAERRRSRAPVTEPTVSHKVGCVALPQQCSAVVRVLVRAKAQVVLGWHERINSNVLLALGRSVAQSQLAAESDGRHQSRALHACCAVARLSLNQRYATDRCRLDLAALPMRLHAL